MAFQDGAQTKRLLDTELVFPICYGTVAFWLGKKADEYRSHRWTVYIRHADNKDLSSIIDKVVFKLHDSFADPIREVRGAPFELTEFGWGEFEISIMLHFKDDVGEKPLELLHPLKLHEEQTPGGADKISTKKPVVSENYDELVFSEPHDCFYHRMSGVELSSEPPTEVSPFFPRHSEEEELAKIYAARKAILQQCRYIEKQLECIL
mmetsp:Transcript_31659/g.43918  ORF Transcript_31659/g.43918 Transcript_31659/m.43918 type:complete len:207 (-) Transcript_31659:192-812(-)